MKNLFIVALLLTIVFTDMHYHRQKNTYSKYQPYQYPQANLDSLYRSSGFFRDADNAQLGAIKDAQQTIITPTRSIDSLFLRLPSSTQLDEVIRSADSVGILKTVQVVATDDSIPCSERIAYLFQVLGRIRCAIQKKQFAADQIQTIIEQTLKELDRLQDQIVRLQEERKGLFLDQLRHKLKKQIKQLEDVYNQFNAVQNQIPPLQAKVNGYQKQIRILTQNSDGQRNRIAQDKLKLTQTKAIIRDLQNQLRAAKNTQQSLEHSISKSEQLIKLNDEKIDRARLKIHELQKRIEQFRDKGDHLRGKATSLEIKVQRLRTDISVAQSKQDKINADIDRNIDRINIEKRKIAQDQLDDINHMISVLKQLVPTVTKQIDRHYYHCYGEGSVQVQQTGSTIVYVVRGQRFGQYIHNAYGKQVKVPALRTGDIQFQRVDVFSESWANTYGHQNHDDKQDFSCLTSSTHKGYGTIAQIDDHEVYVNEHNGKKLRLQIGSCSRIESVTQLPSVGQNIYWSGQPSSADGYNLILASCY